MAHFKVIWIFLWTKKFYGLEELSRRTAKTNQTNNIEKAKEIVKVREMERKRRDERKRRKRGKESKESQERRKTRKEKKKNPFQPLFQSLLHHFSLCCLACMRTAQVGPAVSKAASEALLKNVFWFPFYRELPEQILWRATDFKYNFMAFWISLNVLTAFPRTAFCFLKCCIIFLAHLNFSFFPIFISKQ